MSGGDVAYRIPWSTSGSGEWDNDHTSVPRVYHTDPECQYIKRAAKIVETTVGRAERRGLDECQICRGESIHNGYTDQQCPFCGSSVPQLPAHLPCPDADDGGGRA